MQHHSGMKKEIESSIHKCLTCQIISRETGIRSADVSIQEIFNCSRRERFPKGQKYICTHSVHFPAWYISSYYTVFPRNSWNDHHRSLSWQASCRVVRKGSFFWTIFVFIDGMNGRQTLPTLEDLWSVQVFLQKDIPLCHLSLQCSLESLSNVIIHICTLSVTWSTSERVCEPKNCTFGYCIIYLFREIEEESDMEEFPPPVHLTHSTEF